MDEKAVLTAPFTMMDFYFALLMDREANKAHVKIKQNLLRSKLRLH